MAIPCPTGGVIMAASATGQNWLSSTLVAVAEYKKAELAFCLALDLYFLKLLFHSCILEK